MDRGRAAPAGGTGLWKRGGAARTALLLFLLTLLAFLLRVYRLDDQSAWYDENHYFIAAAPDFQTYVDGVRVWAPDNVILYQVLFWGWTRIFGLSLVAGRLFTVLLGLAVVPLAFLLGRRVFSPAAGWYAALLAALSPAQIWHAQTMRPYGLCVPLVLFGLYALLRAAEGGGRKWWAAALAANIAMMWTHLFMGFLLPAQGLYLLARRPHGLRNALGWAAANLLAVAPPVLWALPRLKLVPSAEHDHLAPPSAWTVLVDAFGDDVIPWSSEFPVAPPDWAASLPSGAPGVLGALWMLLLAGAVLAALPPVARRLRGNDAGPFLMLCAGLLPLLSLLLLSLVWRPCFEIRYTPCSVVCLYVLAGGVLFARPWWGARGAAALLAALLAFQTAWFLPAGSRTAWRAAAEQIGRECGAGDAVLVKSVPMWGVDAFLGNRTLPLPPVIPAHTLESVCRRAARQLSEGTEHVWVVFEMAFFGPDAVEETLRNRMAPLNIAVSCRYYPGMMGLLVARLSRDPGGAAPPAPPPGAAPSFTDYAALLGADGAAPPDPADVDAAREAVDLPLPPGPHAPCVASLLLSEEGHFAPAERCARRAVALQADSPPALLALGIALDGLGRLREAEASLHEAAALDPAYGRLYGRLLYCLFERPDAAFAVRELERLAPLGYPYSLLARMVLRRFPGAAVPDAGMRPPGVRGRPS